MHTSLVQLPYKQSLLNSQGEPMVRTIVSLEVALRQIRFESPMTPELFKKDIEIGFKQDNNLSHKVESMTVDKF